MSEVCGVHHVSFVVADVNRSLGFYCGVIGLEEDLSRPDLGYPGAWLWVGDQQIHLLQIPNPDAVENRPAHVGRDRHAAFSVTNLEAVEDRLVAAGIAYTRSRSGRRALFCRDLDGNGIELIEIA